MSPEPRSLGFRYQLRGKQHEIGLGPLHTISLVEARAMALELRKATLAGIDSDRRQR